MNEADLHPRKAPKQARARETVDVIFEAMIDVLSKHDPSEPSVQAIADRAGVSVGSVYQYFPSKGALISGLIRHHLRARMNELEAALEAAKSLPAEQAAAALVDGLLEEKRRRSKFELAMVRYFCRVGDLPTLTESDERMYSLVRHFLESLGPQIRQTDFDTAAFVICNSLRSAVLLSVFQKPERLADPTLRLELTRLVVGYLKPS